MDLYQKVALSIDKVGGPCSKALENANHSIWKWAPLPRNALVVHGV